MAGDDIDAEVRLAQQFLRDATLPVGVRIVARPSRENGRPVVQLTCHGPEGTRAIRRDPPGAWSDADDATKASMLADLLSQLNT